MEDVLDSMDLKGNDCGHCDASPGPFEPSSAKVSMHPDHASSKRRINRVKGQLDAVTRMIDERRYCPDIINQIRAATNALRGLEQEVLRGHLRGCVKTAFQSKDPFEMEEKINEIMKLMSAK